MYIPSSEIREASGTRTEELAVISDGSQVVARASTYHMQLPPLRFGRMIETAQSSPSVLSGTVEEGTKSQISDKSVLSNYNLSWLSQLAL